jgi:phi LC3 family holin
MNINWKVRIKNKNFWITIIPMVLLLIQAVLAVFGVTIDIGDIGNKILAVVNILFGILATIGVVNDPTTKGLSDSPRALGYHEPA